MLSELNEKKIVLQMFINECTPISHVSKTLEQYHLINFRYVVKFSVILENRI